MENCETGVSPIFTVLQVWQCNFDIFAVHCDAFFHFNDILFSADLHWKCLTRLAVFKHQSPLQLTACSSFCLNYTHTELYTYYIQILYTHTILLFLSKLYTLKLCMCNTMQSMVFASCSAFSLRSRR